MPSHEEIVELAVNRVQPKLIAYRLQCDTQTVYHAIRQARKSGVDIPPFTKGTAPKVERANEPRAQQLVMPVRLYKLLVADAERRDLTIQEAAQRHLEIGLLGGVHADG